MRLSGSVRKLSVRFVSRDTWHADNWREESRHVRPPLAPSWMPSRELMHSQRARLAARLTSSQRQARLLR